MTRCIAAILAVALAGWPSASMAEGARSLRDVFKQVDPSIVVVGTNRHQVVTGPKMQLTTLPGLGSGVLVSVDGKVMTAAHVVQTAEKYKGKYIIYSLGNFVFDQMWSRQTRQGMTAAITFNKMGVTGISFTPVLIENYAQPRVLTGTEAMQVKSRLGLKGV